MILSKELRASLRAYNKNLIKRVRRVACPTCGARKGKKCIGQYGRRNKGCHWGRHYAAKQAGFVHATKGGAV